MIFTWQSRFEFSRQNHYDFGFLGYGFFSAPSPFGTRLQSWHHTACCCCKLSCYCSRSCQAVKLLNMRCDQLINECEWGGGKGYTIPVELAQNYFPGKSVKKSPEKLYFLYFPFWSNKKSILRLLIIQKFAQFLTLFPLTKFRWIWLR